MVAVVSGVMLSVMKACSAVALGLLLAAQLQTMACFLSKLCNFCASQHNDVVQAVRICYVDIRCVVSSKVLNADAII